MKAFIALFLSFVATLPRFVGQDWSWRMTIARTGPGLLLFVPALALAAESIVPVSDPQNSGGWVLIDSLSDEFNGDDLDATKWNNLGLNGNYFGEWQGRAPSQYNPANVSVGGGNLTISSKWDPDFKFSDAKCSNGRQYGKPAPVTTACITSNAKFKYGYLEMRCKAADGPVSSSFWTTGQGGEIDVFEHFGENATNPYSAKRFHSSFHDWRKGSPTFGKRIWTNDHQLDFRVADDFHIYGFEWNQSDVKIYVDGRLVNCVTKQEIGDKWVVSSEQKVWIDAETFDWEVDPSKLKASDFGDGQEFMVDYCRVWENDGAGAECEPRTNLVANPGFETGEKVWNGAAKLSDEMHSGGRAAALIAGGVNKGSSFEQTVHIKPNTTYILSAWAKSPNTNESNLWFNSSLGAKDYGAAEVNTRFFMPYYQQKSVQFTTGPSAKTAVIFFTNNPHGEKAIIDDVELVEAPLPGLQQ